MRFRDMLSAAKSMSINTVLHNVMVAIASLTVCFSFCSAVFSVHVYPDRETMPQFSHY